MASELIARAFEGSTSCLPTLGWLELKDRFVDYESKTRIMELFRRVNSKMVDIDFRKNNILVFPFVDTDDENASKLEIMSFYKVFRAIDQYNLLEESLKDKADVVLVIADSFDNMRVSFRDYFADTTDFFQMVGDALKTED